MTGAHRVLQRGRRTVVRGSPSIATFRSERQYRCHCSLMRFGALPQVRLPLAQRRLVSIQSLGMQPLPPIRSHSR